MPRIAFPVALAAFLTLAGAANAGSTCGEMMDIFRVGATPDERADADDRTFDGCTTAQRALFEINRDAVAQAVAVAPEALYGTWLGDDVALYVQGITTPGQEVMRISPDPDGDGIVLDQFWFRSFAPHGAGPYWNPDTGYAGRVMRVTLQATSEPDTWQLPFAPRPEFGELTFEFERSYQLFIMGRLNHFEIGDVRLRRSDDRLVLWGTVFSQPLRNQIDTVTTYTRVADGAPDLAILTAYLFDQSEVRTFECLTHQFSAKAGPFLDGIAPFTLAEVADLYARAMLLDQERLAIISGALATPPDATVRDRIRDVMDAVIALRQEPLWTTIDAVLGTSGLGCYDP